MATFSFPTPPALPSPQEVISAVGNIVDGIINNLPVPGAGGSVQVTVPGAGGAQLPVDLRGDLVTRAELRSAITGLTNALKANADRDARVVERVAMLESGYTGGEDDEDEDSDNDMLLFLALSGGLSGGTGTGITSNKLLLAMATGEMMFLFL